MFSNSKNCSLYLSNSQQILPSQVVPLLRKRRPKLGAFPCHVNHPEVQSLKWKINNKCITCFFAFDPHKKCLEDQLSGYDHMRVEDCRIKILWARENCHFSRVRGRKISILTGKTKIRQNSGKNKKFEKPNAFLEFTYKAHQLTKIPG